VSLQVREQALDIWRSLIDFSYRDGTWSWEDRQGSNSISDAGQLLCILYPATNVPVLRIDDPDEMAPDVLSALHGLGNGLDALRVFTDVLLEHMERNRLPDGPGLLRGQLRQLLRARQNGDHPGTAPAGGGRLLFDVHHPVSERPGEDSSHDAR
jgi:hypothetical protein